jgi:general secretion pathway protein L
MTLVVTFLPSLDHRDPLVWRLADSAWSQACPLSEFALDEGDDRVVALVQAEAARCIWISLPDLEPRQAEGVAKVRAFEQSLGAVHAVARHIDAGDVVTATIDSNVLETGLGILQARGLNPDVVIPFGLLVPSDPQHVVRAELGDSTVLRGAQFAVPDEPVFRDMLVGDTPIADMDQAALYQALAHASVSPVLNLREGLFAKREPRMIATPAQRAWILRLLGFCILATLLLGVAAFTKYSLATSAENDGALAAARKINPAIGDIAQAETQLSAALQQKGVAEGRFTPLSAGLWRAVQASPNVSVRELRFGRDGILTTVLSAPDAGSINKVLLAVQRDGFRVTATSRQDTTGATLVDLTMRMP